MPADSPRSKTLRRWLYLLFLTLVLEGVIRKFSPAWMKVPAFFAKDLLVFIGGLLVYSTIQTSPARFLWKAYLTTIVLFIPVAIATALHDPLLTVFALDRYLLFPIVAFATAVAFQNASAETIRTFINWTAFLILPTSLLAIVQSRLPPQHWLNMSVTGDSLEGFSAAGQLRLSSSFPFTAQYSFFLNVEVFFLMAALSMSKHSSRLWRILLICLVPLLLAGMYLTVSRTAVLGFAGILSIAAAFLFKKGKVKALLYVVLLAFLFLGSMVVVKSFFSNAVAAYAEREGGRQAGVSEEIQDRLYSALFQWASNGVAPPSLLGYGLGVMSNGSWKLSSYAASWRYWGTWTETDYATTMFEGGFYLMLVWYGFRYFVIYATSQRYFQQTSGTFEIPGAFCQGYVVLTGVLGTLALQPPVSIWWWSTVGFAVTFWWRSAHPLAGEEGAIDAEPVQVAALPRGRSVYAEKLHSGEQ